MQNNVYTYLKFVLFRDLENWSVSHLLGKDMGYTDKYSIVSIGEIIDKCQCPTEIKDDIQYKQITLKTNGGGAVLRGIKWGKDIRTKKQYIASDGQFIMSKIDARNGAFGVITKDLDGAVVTADFPLFDVNTTKIFPAYLALIASTKKFAQFAQSCSRGTTNRQRIDINLFLSQQIPLPSLSEQKVIVSAYEHKIQEAATLEDQAKQIEHNIEDYLLSELGIQHKDYPMSEPSMSIASEPQVEYNASQKQGSDMPASHHWTGEIKKEYKYLKFVKFKDVTEWGYDRINIFIPKTATYPLVKLNALIKEGYRGKSPIYKESESSFILNQKCNRWNEIDLRYKKSVDAKWLSTIKKDMFTQEGDVLINSTGEGTLGRTTVITKDFANLLYDSHLLLIRVNEKILPCYLVLVLNSTYGQGQINTYKSALATKQTELGLDNLKKIQIPLPHTIVQNAIVKHINKQKSQIKELKLLAEDLRKEALVELEKEIFE